MGRLYKLFTAEMQVMAMPPTVREIVVAEPSGHPQTVVMFAGATLFWSGYVVSGIAGGFTIAHELFLGMGFGLSGVAESLPTDNRGLAGVFRVTALLVLLSVAATIFLPL